MVSKYAIVSAVVGLWSFNAMADYDLLHPVPAGQLREMATERPNRSDTALTVDAGHYQLETSIVSYTHDNRCAEGDCTREHEWDVGAGTTIRAGLTQSSEFQVVFDGYRHDNLSDPTSGSNALDDGFGDTTLRYKYNFWGNEGGKTALAGMAFVKLPTNQDNLGNNAFEGGVELPFIYKFTEGLELNGMTQLNVLKSDNDARQYYLGYVNVVGLSKEITQDVSAYAELFTFLPDTEGRDWENTVDLGVTYALTPSVQCDTGVNLGVTDAAPDFQTFAGISWRF